jgi:phage gp36-like protein
VSYNTPDEYDDRSILVAALTGFTDPQKQIALDAAQAVIDSYIGSVVTLPLATYGEDIRGAEAKIADYEMLSRRGYNPDGGSDSNIRMRHDDALRWLEAVARGSARILSPDNVDATPSTYEGSSYTVTRAKRGW